MKLGLVLASAAALGVLSLSGCDKPQPAKPEVSKAALPLRFANPRLALPAVKGNPGALYFSITNSGSGDIAFSDPVITGADSAMIHGAAMDEVTSQTVKPGETATFAPGGQHVMAMGLADTLTPGSSTRVTLHLDNGRTATFQARVMAAGEAR